MSSSQHYRYQKIKGKKVNQDEYRKLAVTAGILVISIVLVFFVGIPFLAKMGGFLSKLFQGDVITTNGKQDNLAPSAPYIESLPEGTKEKSVEIKGLAESGSKVTLILNGERLKESLADGEGKFTFDNVALKEGENKITAVAKDDAGNESDPASEVTVTYKNSAPSLEIITPSENQLFKDVENPIRVSGKTDSGAKVYVNDTLAIVDSSGNFEKYLVLRDEGENIIKLKSLDIAGNTTEKEVKVVFRKK